MMTAPEVPDGAELRDEGMQRAARSIVRRHPVTYAAAGAYLMNLAAGEGYFTSEDVIAHLERRGLITEDQGLWWLGKLFSDAIAAKLIERVDYVPSVRPGRHRGPVAQYQGGPGVTKIAVDMVDTPMRYLPVAIDHPDAWRAANRQLVRLAVSRKPFTAGTVATHLHSRGVYVDGCHRWIRHLIDDAVELRIVERIEPRRARWIGAPRAELIRVFEWDLMVHQFGPILLRRKAQADLSRVAFEAENPRPAGPVTVCSNGPGFGIVAGPSL